MPVVCAAEQLATLSTLLALVCYALSQSLCPYAEGCFLVCTGAADPCLKNEKQLVMQAEMAQTSCTGHSVNPAQAPHTLLQPPGPEMYPMLNAEQQVDRGRGRILVLANLAQS